MTITISNARILTLAGATAPRRGRDLGDLGVIPCGYVQIEGDRIAAVGAGSPPSAPGEVLDARYRVLLPAFVDCHTHACWAGDRFEEHRAAPHRRELPRHPRGRRRDHVDGAGRAPASRDELTELLLWRLSKMATLGTATVEVKSGYGLDPETELKMLEAIGAAGEIAPLTFVPTFLGAHAIDPDRPGFVEETINETLPAVATSFPGIVCDAYCENGAWSLADTRRLFENALDLGCPIRVHADQFTSLGMTRLAVEMGARSVDHLEVVVPSDLEHLARSDTIAVALPCSGFHLDDRYAPAREIVDAGGALAIATNYNPGSAPTPSMPFCIALACRKLRLTPAEAITAATINAASVLDQADEVGSIEVGKRADVQLLDCTDERELGFELAGPGPGLMIVAGQLIGRRPPWHDEGASRARD